MEVSRTYTKPNDIAKVVQCYKRGLDSRQTSVETGVPERTVRRLIGKFKANGESEIPRHRYGGGRPPKISEKTLTVIREELERNPDTTATQIKERYASVLQGVSLRSIQRHIRNKLKYREVRAPCEEGKCIAENTGTALSTVQLQAEKIRNADPGLLPTPKKRPLKKRKLSKSTLDAIKRQVDSSPTITAKELKQKNLKMLGHVAIRTLQDHILKFKRCGPHKVISAHLLCHGRKRGR